MRFYIRLETDSIQNHVMLWCDLFVGMEQGKDEEPMLLGSLAAVRITKLHRPLACLGLLSPIEHHEVLNLAVHEVRAK